MQITVNLNDADLLARLKNFEDHFVERKTSGDKKSDWLKTAVAFANSAPVGFPCALYLGVKDKGEIETPQINLDTIQKTFNQEMKNAYLPEAERLLGQCRSETQGGMMAIQENALIGTWKSDPSDSAGRDAYGDATLKFGSDGTLLYTIHESDRDQVMRLTYQTEPGAIVTDQPSQPGPERTEYQFAEDGALVLAFGGRKSRYLKVK